MKALMMANKIDINDIKHKLHKLIEKYNQLKLEKNKKGLRELSEANVRKDFIDPLFEILGWNIRDSYEYDAETYVRGTGFADISIKLNGKSIIFVEAKRFGGVPSKSERGVQTTLQGLKIYADWTEEERQVLNYAGMTVGAKWAILTNFEKFRLFNARTGDTVLNIEKPEEYFERINDLMFLTKRNVENGNINKLETRFERPDVDLGFLNSLNDWRLKLSINIYKNCKDIELDDIKKYVQRIINRLIIIRYAEDGWILKDPDQLKAGYDFWLKTKTYTKLTEILKGFFHGFEQIYDSKIFEKDDELDRILERIDSKVLGNIIKELYDQNFRKFTSDILGNTYESYLGHELYFKIDGELGLRLNSQVRKSGGIYYTPPVIVEYIVKNTLGVQLEYIWKEAEKLFNEGKYDEAAEKFREVSQIKIVDPACGSGSFLIKAFNLFKEYYEMYNKKCEEANDTITREITILRKEGKNKEAWFLEGKRRYKLEKYEKEILQKNIYGVDLDHEACEISSVNLMLQALRRDEKLPLILEETNKSGDSLISGTEEELMKYFGDNWQEKRPFNWEIEFPEVFKQGGFNGIIGNPPWVSFGLRGVGKIPKNLDRYLRDKYDAAEYKLSIYPIFVNRAIDLLKFNGRFGFILPDSFLLGRYFSKLRRYILNLTSIKEIVLILEDFWPHGTIGRSVIIFLKKESDEKQRRNNKVIVRLCQTLEDFGKRNFLTYSYKQEYFENIKYNKFRLFFNRQSKELIEKIERDSKKLEEIVSIHTGVRSKIGQKMIISKIEQGKTWKKGLISGSEMNRYIMRYEGHFLNIEPNILWSGGWDPKVVLRDKLLMRQTGDSLIATYDDKKYYHLNNLHSIILKDEQYSLKYVLAILNSKLMNHYYHLISLELGRALAQTDIETIEQLPICKIDFSKLEEKIIHDELVKLANKIILLNKQRSWLIETYKNLLRNFDLTKEEPLNYFFDPLSPKKSEKYGINIARTERISRNEKGVILEYKLELSGNYVIIKLRCENKDRIVDVIKLYFENEILRDYFFIALKQCAGRRGYRNEKAIFETAMKDMVIFRCKKSNLFEDTSTVISMMSTLRKEYEKKLSDEFKDSPIQKLNLAKIEKEIERTDNKIDKLIYQLYKLTADETKTIEKYEKKRT